jgi:hypothetical protein
MIPAAGGLNGMQTEEKNSKPEQEGQCSTPKLNRSSHFP